MTVQDDDLYGGYDEMATYGASTGAQAFKPLASEGFGSLRTGTASIRGPGPPGTMSTSRIGTASQEMARPMTSNRGAGFVSGPRGTFDPLGQSSHPSSPLSTLNSTKRSDLSPEDQVRDMEKRVHELLEESTELGQGGDWAAALEKAMEARKKERAMTRMMEQSNLADQINFDLTYAVEFNLAHVYQMNDMHEEALQAYQAIVKNKQLPQSGRLRVNMGNIHFCQKKYSTAIKMYRMALDQVPATAKDMRFKIMKNIGLAFVQLGQYQDALKAFESVMENVPDHQTGYNLVVCAYALGDKEMMQQSFLRLLQVAYEEEKEDTSDDEDEEKDIMMMSEEDGLREEIRRRQRYIHRCVLNSARLIAEKLDRNGFVPGYDWCVEQLRNAENPKLANELELAKANRLMMERNFEGAVAVLKEFERKGPRVRARAATNLAFLYLLEGDTANASKYCDLALKTDAYNARAQVNKGALLVAGEDLEGARSAFEEACTTDPLCVEAWYNLGLVSVRLGDLETGLAVFKKLHNMLPNNVEVMFQISRCLDLMGDVQRSIEWLEMLSSLMPHDPGVLSGLGALHVRSEDEARALQCYQESHRLFPVNMDVISWLGALHVKSEMYENAIPYFDLAARIHPQEVKWSLMVASCYRRIGAYPSAMAKYKQIHASYPDNVECLHYLVHMCTELGAREEAREYMKKLRKAESMQAPPPASSPSSPQGPTMTSKVSNGEELIITPSGGQDYDEPGIRMVSTLQAPGMGNKKVVAKGTSVSPTRVQDDDWGDEGLGEDLLPM